MSQNRYEVLGKIAEGGLGAVYKAYDRNLRREVALKRVRADTQEQANQQAEQLFQEARTLSALQHPHIVTIFDVGQDEEGAYIVMELLKGETLEDIIERGALNEGDFRDLVYQSLEGMISAHATGLIHLDIKPQNFMVIWLPSGKFQIKILDFGLSMIAHQPLIQETDENGAVLGSIYFMAPEQFERSPVDVRTDLYSLACVYYFALTQNYPFQGETAPEVMASHLYHSLIPLQELRPDLPKFIPQWIEWLMSRDPNNRPSSAQEALEILRDGQFPVNLAAPMPDYVLPTPDIGIAGSTTSQMLRPDAPRRPKPTASQSLGKRVPKPTARPLRIAAAAAPQHLKPERKLPRWLTLWVPLAALILTIVTINIIFLTKSRREARLSELAKASAPAGSMKDIPILLRFLENPEKSATAGQVLGKLQGVESANRLLLTRLGETESPQATMNLAAAIAERRIPDATPALLRQLERYTEPSVRISLWNSLAGVATNAEMADLVSALKPEPAEELRAAEATLLSAARTEPDPVKRSRPILESYRASQGKADLQASLLRVLCKLGSPEALGDILKSLQNPDAKLRTATSQALIDWPTAAPVPALLQFIGREGNAFIRSNAVKSIGVLARLSGDVPQDEIAEELIEQYKKTKDRRDQTTILETLRGVVSPASQGFFQDVAEKDVNQKELAEAALTSITMALRKATPVVDAVTVLSAPNADLEGGLILQNNIVSNWVNSGDQVNWLVKVEKPGKFQVQINQASTGTEVGRYTLTFGKERFQRAVEKTSNPDTFKSVSLGAATFSKPGYYRIWVLPNQIPKGGALMRLKDVSLHLQP